MNRYVLNVLIGIDRFGNVLLAGDPDETISARSGRLRNIHPHTWGVLANALDRIQRNHVEKAIVHDEQRAEHTDAVEEAAEKKASEPGWSAGGAPPVVR